MFFFAMVFLSLHSFYICLVVLMSVSDFIQLLSFITPPLWWIPLIQSFGLIHFSHWVVRSLGRPVFKIIHSLAFSWLISFVCSFYFYSQSWTLLTSATEVSATHPSCHVFSICLPVHILLCSDRYTSTRGSSWWLLRKHCDKKCSDEYNPWY